MCCRQLASACSALGLLDTAAQGWATHNLTADAEVAVFAAVKKRMKESSMLVHPDKCSLPGTKEVCNLHFLCITAMLNVGLHSATSHTGALLPSQRQQQ